MVLHNKGAYPKVCFELLSYMESKWPEHLTYHTISHIIDVANVCDHYIRFYDIDEESANLIRIAAIGHDMGYLKTPVDHEEVGIIEIRPFLQPILSETEIELVSGMIRATKVPQNPTNFYEEILADADLDYLGRKDYDILSAGLYKEFLYYEVVSNDMDWLNVQINFLENHRYHTAFAKENRCELKLKKLKELKQKRIKLEF
ncbi:MAG: HD domain-containing protein [Eudoraea sp.]|nr:HD domain-containing protein [Eudoraea sp.]